jgi:drug/metabolite transporter (DMT)-like permease
LEQIVTMAVISRTNRKSDAFKSYFSGVALVAVAAAVWSLNGVFTRLIAASVATQIAGRSLFGALFLAGYLIVREKRVPSVRSLPKAGYWLIAALAVSQTCTVFAFNFTTIANVNLIYAISPFIAAWLAKWLGNEDLPVRTVIASVGCLAGVYVLAGPSSVQGNAVGIAFAVLMSLSFAFALVLNRVYPDLPMLPITISSALIVSLVFAPLANLETLTLSSTAWLAGFGLSSFVIGMVLFLSGARRIPAALAALIAALEFMFAPFWGILFFGEPITKELIIGAALILVSVISHGILDVRVTSSKVLL